MSHINLKTLCLCAGLGFSLVGGQTMSAQTRQTKVTDANVIGHVIDAKTGEHLVGLTIAIKGTSFGTSTDMTGHYFLKNLKPGPIILVLRGVGYKSQECQVNVSLNKTIEVNFEAEEDNIKLDEVVVTANRQATLRRYAPALVNVVDQKVFERAGANNLAQGIIFQPGLRVENNCQNCGFNQVRINGLDGRYSQILIDSRPIISSLAGVYGLEMIPANMIERVEVVRGGGSALYGSSAIAGVVNVITKEPKNNSVSFTESLGMTGFKSLDNNLGFNASIVSQDNRTGAMLFGQTRYRQAHDMNGDNYSELGRLDSRALGFRGYIRPTDLTMLTGELHSISEDRRGGDHLDWPEHVAGVAEATRHSIYGANAKFDAYSHGYKHHLQLYVSGQYVRRNSYYGGIGEIDINGKPGGTLGNPIPGDKFGLNYGLSKGRTFVGGAQYSFDFDRLWFLPAQLLFGVEFSYDHLHDTMPQRSWIIDEATKMPLFPDINQTIRNYSQFGQIEWKNDKWTLLLGARLDENSAVKTKTGGISPILSPRATLRYNPTSDINLRATYAKGFRAPQVFDEDLHVGVVNGEAQRVENAPDLSPEVSHSFSVSSDMYFRFGSRTQLNVLVEGFYTRLLDVFTNNKIDERAGIVYYQRNNYGIDDNGQRVSSGAKIFGVNLEAKLAYDWLQVQTGLTLTSNKYDANQEWGVRAKIKGLAEDKYMDYNPKNDASDFENGDETVSMTSKEILRTPSVYGYFTIGVNPIKPLSISLTGTYTGRMWAPHAVVFGQGSAQSDRDAIAKGRLRLDDPRFPKYLNKDGEMVSREYQWDELVRTKSFFDLGAKVSYDFKLFTHTSLQIFAGVNNLFNAFQSDFDFGPDRDSAYIYGPTTPRSGYLGLKFTF